MHDFNLPEFITSTLTKTERYTLIDVLEILDDNQRLLSIRNFFLQPSIFQKINTVADPMWIANQVYLQTKLQNII